MVRAGWNLRDVSGPNSSVTGSLITELLHTVNGGGPEERKGDSQSGHRTAQAPRRCTLRGQVHTAPLQGGSTPQRDSVCTAPAFAKVLVHSGLLLPVRSVTAKSRYEVDLCGASGLRYRL